MEKNKKAKKTGFEKALKDYIKKLNKEEQFKIATGLWHVWNASKMYHENKYGAVKRHSDISDMALIALNAYNEE